MKNLNWSKMNNLIPAIIQDFATSKVLMLGYMNQAALDKTLETKKVTFFSRSKDRLWTKGETSGNFLEFVSAQPDCDNDAILIKAKPVGPTCHTGTESCFSNQDFNLADLYALIKKRKAEMPEGSYTTSLFAAGPDRICTKIAEESGEVIKAATKETKQRLVEESVDLIYHLMVLMAEQGISMAEINHEIHQRHQ